MRGVKEDHEVVIAVSKKAGETFATITVVPAAQRLNPAIHVVMHVDLTQGKDRFTDALAALARTTVHLDLLKKIVAALEEAEARLSG